ncbi:MAG: PKD domain-containing protein [Chitinophagaceae bacterium]|nr:PKD domain-containing protein [Chitinophagaceae bacterium]
MKKYLFVFGLSLFSLVSFANHTKGGWMYYQYIGPGSSANTLKYRITLKLYTACVLSNGQFDETINFSVFDGSGNNLLYSLPVTYNNLIDIQNCATQECHPCINFIPTICYKIITYEIIQDLPKTAGGYTIAYQRCCRITGIVNLQSPSNSIGETWTVKIPGTAVAGAETNSSARFSQNDTAIICQGAHFTFDFSAIDPNNDSLSYSFTSAYSGGGQGNPTPDPATSPPYASVPYSGGFSGSQPLGSQVTINNKTGIVSGIAPNSGIYVITVTVSEYRRGTNIKIAEVRKSLHIEVANCSLTQASLDPEYLSCDGFTVNFFNNASSTNIQTYDWDFGDGGTSNLPSPTHTYGDTGIYILKLAVNRGLPCSDSATAIVKVYPGFFPDFDFQGQCTTIPIQFRDLTTVAYGVVNKWVWNFGDPGSPLNTSTLQNPTHLYNAAQNYNVEFFVSSDKGCADTVRKTITILTGPPLTVSNDTLICTIDTLQLNAVGAGNFTWSPNYMISNVNAPNPLVSPDVTTTYRVRLTDPFGCYAEDTVRVRVVNQVTQFSDYDTTVCQKDALILRLNSDALYFNWTPNDGSLSSTTVKNPTALPLATTTYRVTGSISAKCFAQNTINVKVVPYPAANAGPDIPLCLGNSTQLNATGGSIYSGPLPFS